MHTLSLALVVSLLAFPAMAQDTDPLLPDQAVRVTGVSSNLNVRAGPDTTYPVVSSLAAGQSGLTIIGCNGAADWCRVSNAGGALGWVAARYLTGKTGTVSADAPAVVKPRFSEAARLSAVTGIVVDPGGTTTVPELPPYLLGSWYAEGVACADATDETRVTVQKNGLRIGMATARFKTALFRNGGYDLTTLLMAQQDVPNAVPQRALYRLEPGPDTLAVSGDVLATLRLRRCGG